MKNLLSLLLLLGLIANEAVAQNVVKPEEVVQASVLSTKLVNSTIDTLLTDNWGGVNCYDDDSVAVFPLNYFTPWHYSAGCVAISMAQVLHYWEWPKTGVGSHTYTDNQNDSQKTYSVDFSSQTYDYDNMLDNYYYQPSTDVQRRAVGYLAYHCAVSVDMDFESYGSTSNVSRQPDALNNYFRFSGHYKTRTWDSFWTRMKENLRDGKPVLIAIKDVDNTGAGHALVVDGYDETTGLYHLNWGWHGRYNDWYDIEFGWDGTGDGYDLVEAAVFDILPNPEITEILRGDVEKQYTLKWHVADKLNWESFSVEQQKDGGDWEVIAAEVLDTQLNISVVESGTYNYRVRAKINGGYFYNAYSEGMSVFVKDDIVALEFDGDDSFFIYDNSSNDLDVSDEWTIETWFNVANHTSGTYPVLLDRKTVFSLYVIDDNNTQADYALRFAARNSYGSIVASLRSDNSLAVLNYGDWHHVAISRKSNKTYLFIDGKLVETSTDKDFNLTSTTGALNVGARYWSGYERYFNGKIDGIAISSEGKYISGFTPNIQENYPLTENSVLALNLDEGIGTDLADEAGNFSTVKLRVSPNQANWVFESFIGSLRKTLDSESVLIENEISIYPTVVNDEFNIKINQAVGEKFNYHIYNSLGQLIKAGNSILKDGKAYRVGVNTFTKGIYIVKVNSSDFSVTKRIMIRK
ncbi:MAG: C10 family peptidase [Bacteroidota bacterium]